MGRVRVDLGRVGLVQTAHVAAELDHRHLHAKADAQKRHALFAGVAHGRNLALGAALAKAHRDQYTVGLAERVRKLAGLKLFGVDMVHLDPTLIGKAAMGQGFVQALVRVNQLDVFADHGDPYLVSRLLKRPHDFFPAAQVRVPVHMFSLSTTH